MRSNFRFALRALIKSPTYTGITLLTLTLGIAVSTSTFSVLNALVLHRWPFPKSEQLMSIHAQLHGMAIQEFSEPEIREIREHETSFSALTAITSRTVAVSDSGLTTEPLEEMQASHELFSTLGLQPILGRGFTADETEPGRNQVVLLGFLYWQKHFNGSPDVIGKTLRIDSDVVTIIGVVPTSFEHLPLWGQAEGNMDLWRPINFSRTQQLRSVRLFGMIGRLKEGVSAERATAELASLAHQQEIEHPAEYPSIQYSVEPLSRTLMSGSGTKITWMLFGLSGFVLLIACANLANLQLARISAESRALAIRLALGATPWRLLTRQLTESALLSFTGGVLGCGAAYIINHLLERSISATDGAGHGIPIDGSVLLLSLSIVVATSILFGALPSWFASRVNVNSVLKTQSRGSTEGPQQHGMRSALIIGEVALALVLLAGAGIMEIGLNNFLQHRPGWDTASILTAALPIPEQRFNTPEKLIAYLRRVEFELKQNPGVESVAIASSLPLWNHSSSRPVFSEARAGESQAQHSRAFHIMVTPDYFSTMGIAFVSGKSFAPDVKFTDPPVAIVNESLARHFWPGEDAVGKRIATVEGESVRWRQVVGVVHDVESAADFDHPSTQFQLYRPIVQEPWPWAYTAVRSRNPQLQAENLRRTLIGIDPEIPPIQVITATEFVRRSHHNVNVIAKILLGFSALGVVLAIIGIYGVISHFVAQRQVEFGIRMALGASPKSVLLLVLKQALVLALCGTAIGLVGAFALGKSLQAFIPRIAGPNPIALIGASLLLLMVAVVASLIPARRATRIDPLIATRAE